MGNIPSVVKQFFCCSPYHWLGRAVVGATFVCLSATLSSRFYWEPQLYVGKIVPNDIRLPATGKLVVDQENTRQAVERARRDVPLIYRVDMNANGTAVRHLEELLAIGDQIRSLAGQMPYVSTGFVSYKTQIYLRSCSEVAWQEIQQRVDLERNQIKSLQISPLPLSPDTDLSSRAVGELLRRKLVNESEYQNLIQAIAAARQKYRMAKAELIESPSMYRSHLLDLRDLDWQLDKYAARKALDDLLASGVVAGLPEELRQYRIRSQRGLPTDPDRQDIVLGLLNAVVIPNLTPDYPATEKQIAKAAEQIKSRLMSLRAGQIIVRAGQQINSDQFETLDRYGLTQRQPNLLKISAMSAGVALSMLIFAQLSKRWSLWLSIGLKTRDLAAIGIVCNATALAGMLVGRGLMPFVLLPSMGMMLGSFYGSRLATLTTLLGLGLFAIGIGATLIDYAPVMLGAILASLLTNRPSTRSQLALTGVVVALVQAGIYASLALMLGTVPLIAIATTALHYAAGGMLSSIIALGAIPYLEQISYALTPIRLAELANLDRPLLRRLVTEAPGTFQHTLFVANLAEAAAREIGADTALVRTGTLYHDVGKTIRPEFFIENQMGQPNPHDLLDDPWRSAQIIKEHVTGGIKIAQKFHLPEQLQAFIPEHQGKIIIAYFYHKAQLLSPEAQEADFRYEGPIPQSRETGVVMLADACEAALRSLGTDTTMEEGNAMLMRIFQSRIDDGQLKDAGLTHEDLEKIAPVFIRVWRERNHGRIKYPALVQKIDPTGAELPATPAPVLEPVTKVEKV